MSLLGGNLPWDPSKRIKSPSSARSISSAMLYSSYPLKLWCANKSLGMLLKCVFPFGISGAWDLAFVMSLQGKTLVGQQGGCSGAKVTPGWSAVSKSRCCLRGWAYKFMGEGIIGGVLGREESVRSSFIHPHWTTVSTMVAGQWHCTKVKERS